MDPGYSWGGGGAQKIMCAHAHHEDETQSPGPPLHSNGTRGYLCSFPITGPPPPPPIAGIRIYPVSRALVTIGNYKKHPISGFSREIFPRLRPKISPFPEKIGIRMRPPSCTRGRARVRAPKLSGGYNALLSLWTLFVSILIQNGKKSWSIIWGAPCWAPVSIRTEKYSTIKIYKLHYSGKILMHVHHTVCSQIRNTTTIRTIVSSNYNAWGWAKWSVTSKMVQCKDNFSNNNLGFKFTCYNLRILPMIV